jgi:hypothetical protein
VLRRDQHRPTGVAAERHALEAAKTGGPVGRGAAITKPGCSRAASTAPAIRWSLPVMPKAKWALLADGPFTAADRPSI